MCQCTYILHVVHTCVHVQMLNANVPPLPFLSLFTTIGTASIPANVAPFVWFRVKVCRVVAGQVGAIVQGVLFEMKRKLAGASFHCFFGFGPVQAIIPQRRVGAALWLALS